MSILHICNTFFDLELFKTPFPSLENAFDQHEVYLQLQFLPFLYGSKEDGVVVSFMPDNTFWEHLENLNIFPPKLHLIQEEKFPPYQYLNIWGHSPTIAKWAEKKQLPYTIPPWSIVQRVNSKAFSFEESPLPGGKLIYNEEELIEWVKTVKGNKVLKTCFGTAGIGHFIFMEEDFLKAKTFAEKEWKEKRPVIAEPWMKRILDFSTQWEISKNGEIRKIGTTICENDPKGKYRRNTVGNLSKLFGVHLRKLEEHEVFVQKVLSKIARVGYFGNVGIDAMIYEMENGEVKLQPIVEINARKTMGWILLAIQQRHFPGKDLQLDFTKENIGLLPLFGLKQNGTKVKFSRHIQIQIISAE